MFFPSFGINKLDKLLMPWGHPWPPCKASAPHCGFESWFGQKRSCGELSGGFSAYLWCACSSTQGVKQFWDLPLPIIRWTLLISNDIIYWFKMPCKISNIYKYKINIKHIHMYKIYVKAKYKEII